MENKIQEAEDAVQSASIDLGHEISGVFIMQVDWDVLVSASHSCLDGYAQGFVEKEIIEKLPASVIYRIWQKELGELGTVEIRKLGEKKSQIDISGVPLDAEKLPDWEQTKKDLQGKPKERIHKALADKSKKLKVKRAQMKNRQADVIRAFFSRLSQEQIWQADPADLQPVATVKAEKPRQKGRYRLEPKDIKFRKKKVKEVEKIKKENPRKTLKEICYELDIPERTFRYWRHENY